MSKQTLLVISKYKTVQKHLEKTCQAAGLQMIVASGTAGHIEKKIKKTRPTLVVVDVASRQSASFYTRLRQIQQTYRLSYLFLIKSKAPQSVKELTAFYPCALAGKPLDKNQLPKLIETIIAQRPFAPQSREKSETQTKNKAENFRTFTAIIPVAIIIYRGKKIIYANPAAEKITGYSQKELLAKNFWETVHPNFQPLIKQRGLERQKGKSPPPHYGFKIITKSGREKWLYIYTQPFQYENQKAVMISALDITAWKQAERDLRESESKYRLLVENVNDAIVISQKDKFIYYNRQFPAMLGYQYRELMGANFKQVYTPAGVKKLYARQKLRAQGEAVPQRYETQLQKKNSGTVWVEISSRIIDYNGRVATFAVIRNIDQQKKTLKRLEHERYLFRTLMENLSDAIYFKDKQSRFIRANKVVARRFGFQQPAALYGKTDFDFFSETHAQEAYADEQRIIKTGEPIINKEEQEAWPNGRVSWALTTKMPLYDENGTIVGTFGTGKDITSIKNIEAALRQSEHNLEQIIQGSSVPIFVIDKDHRVTHWNKAMENITRISAEKMQGTNRHWEPFYSKQQPVLADFIIDGSKAVEIDQHQKVKVYKSPVIKGAYEGTEFVPKVGGRARWLYFTAAPIKDSAGRVIAAIETLQDITPLKEAQEAINTQKQYFEALFNSSASAIVSLDQNDKILNVNPQFEALFGYRKTEVLGKDIDALIARTDNYHAAQKITRRVARGDIIHQEAVRYKKNGTPVSVTISGSPILVNGQQIGSLGIYADITAHKQNEKALKAAKQEAEKANQAKNIFLANMSHELRTPMNAILGFTEILESTVADKAQAQYLAAIKSSGRMLLDLINDILDLSKIEAGRLELDYKPVNIFSIIEDIKNTFKFKMQEKELAIIVQTDPALPPYLFVDEVRLRQILYNLIGNALKFTHHGHVKLIVKKVREHKRSNAIDLQFKVVDTGIGIPKDQQNLIFKAFFQQRGQDRSKYGGSGLGLSITKNLINQMGGEIKVESHVDRGSTFQFTLPKIQKSRTQPEYQRQPLPSSAINLARPFNILIVSNMNAAQELLKAYLDHPALRLQTARNSNQACEQLKTKRPDLIITDIQGQHKNAFKDIKKLKSVLPGLDIPLLPLTGADNAEINKKLTALGCQDYLVKPINKKELLQKITHFIPKEKLGAGPSVVAAKTAASRTEEKLTAALDQQSAERLKCLQNILQQDFVPLWQTIKQNFVINDIEGFARELGQVADQFQLTPLKEWTLKLIEASQNFDMEILPDILEYFDTILTKIEAQATPHENNGKGTIK